jgi:hypothetical protein
VRVKVRNKEQRAKEPKRKRGGWRKRQKRDRDTGSERGKVRDEQKEV